MGGGDAVGLAAPVAPVAAFVDADRYWLHGTGRISDNLATVIGVVFATLFRLFCYRRFVFNLVPPAPVEEMAELATAL